MVDRTTVQVADLQAAESDFPQGAADAKQYGHRTTLATPLLREGNPIGVIVIRRTAVKPFTQKETALLEIFADQAVIAIENARLFDEVQTRTRDLTESLAAADRHRRGAQGHQPIDVRSAGGARHTDASRPPYFVRRRWRRCHGAEADGIPPRTTWISSESANISTIRFPPGRGSVVGRTLLERTMFTCLTFGLTPNTR